MYTFPARPWLGEVLCAMFPQENTSLLTNTMLRRKSPRILEERISSAWCQIPCNMFAISGLSSDTIILLSPKAENLQYGNEREPVMINSQSVQQAMQYYTCLCPISCCPTSLLDCQLPPSADCRHEMKSENPSPP